MAREFANVEKTVMIRFGAQLSGSSSIHWPRTDFDSKKVTEWLEPRVIGPVNAPARRGDRVEAWILNVNIYIKTGETSAGVQEENIYRGKELSDLVYAVFHQKNLNLQDWGAGGDPVIGVLQFEEMQENEVQGKVLKASTYQLNASVPFNLILAG